MNTGKKYWLIVYGCQMNESEAERMAAQLHADGYTRADCMDEASLILIHTCCVRATAEERAYGKIGEIKHLKEQNPALVFGVTGCMAQKEQDALMQRAPHIDFVLGTGRISELISIVHNIQETRQHIIDTDINAATAIDMADGTPKQKREELLLATHRNRLSAWVPIMNGCNNFCTYCIVPYVRGRERSRTPENILQEIQAAASAGCKEVTLLGQNVNSYGKDCGGISFAQLLRMADEVSGIQRIRFLTSHPKDLSDDVIQTMKNGKALCEHIHLPVQHASDKMLRAMHRIYNKAQYRILVRKIREALPHVSLTSDLIVGFPGETEEDFAELLDFLQEIRFDAAYTFLYSQRTGTPAAKMHEQIADDEKKRRLHKLMDVQNTISLEINQKMLGKTVEIMVEGASKHDKMVWTGRTRTNKTVLFPHGTEQIGDFVQIKITHPQTWVLKGTRV